MMKDIIIAGPGGNYTAFVFQAALPQQARVEIDNNLRQQYPIIEQTCFVTKADDIWRGEMAGGEFCGAAALGIAYLISRQEEKEEVLFSFSGCDDLLSAKVTDGQVTAEFFQIGKDAVRKLRGNLYVVDLPGITHFVTFDEVPLPQAKLRQLIMQYQMQDRSAVGLMIVKSETEYPMIDPWVWVSGVDSLINETACISGAAATALVLQSISQESRYLINQPCQTPTQIFLDSRENDTTLRVSSNFNFYVPNEEKLAIGGKYAK